MSVVWKVGDRVTGKTAKTRGKSGVVHNVYKEKRQHTYDVAWDSGSTERVAARAITGKHAIPARPQAENDQVESFMDLLGAAQSSGAKDDDAFSYGSSSDEDAKEVNSARAVSGEAVTILLERVECHGREWVLCSDVLDDPGATTRYTTRFNWPEVLDLGVKTYAKYFYLMFPIDFMPLLVGFTNKNLQKLRYANTTVGEM